MRGEKRTRKCNVEPSLVFQEMKNLKKRLMLNGIKGVITSKLDLTQLILQTVKGNVLRIS